MDRLITVAIHTYDRAVALRSLLEAEGVEAVLQNVNLSDPVVSAGVRVRIHESDLPLALRIIENPEIFTPGVTTTGPHGAKGAGPHVLVPVDVSERSLQAARAGFALAARTGASVVLLHAYLVPQTGTLQSISKSLTFDKPSLSLVSSKAKEYAAVASGGMDRFTSRLRKAIKNGEIEAAPFTTVLVEGVAEECIGQYVRDHSDIRLLVMATRGAKRKALDLAGSITAEVLDSTRVLALTVPEGDASFTALRHVGRVALLSSLEQEDFLALDAMARLMPQGSPLQVDVICLPASKYSAETVNDARSALLDYCRGHFPDYTFNIDPDPKAMDDIASRGYDMIVVPNRKRNILQRLFNPGLAHRILFNTDIPMMVVPV